MSVWPRIWHSGGAHSNKEFHIIFLQPWTINTTFFIPPPLLAGTTRSGTTSTVIDGHVAYTRTRKWGWQSSYTYKTSNCEQYATVKVIGTCLYTQYSYPGTSAHCKKRILHWFDMSEDLKWAEKRLTHRSYVDNDLTKQKFGIHVHCMSLLLMPDLLREQIVTKT